MIELHRHGDLAELRIQHRKELNPFSIAMTRELMEHCAELEADDTVAGVLVWGGPERCFSIGGDFEDIRALATVEEVHAYLDLIVGSYQAMLEVSKPVVTAIDRHAIGQGLQVALLGDWRVGTQRSEYRMPELANGVACPLGSVLLESFLGRAAMLHLVMGCSSLDADEARGLGLIDEIVPYDGLFATAMERLAKLRGYPQEPFRNTKRIHNARLVQSLQVVRRAAMEAHAASFVEKSGDAHFARVLGDAH